MEGREGDHHHEDPGDEADVGEVLVAVGVGDGNQLIEADEDHDPGDEGDGGGEDGVGKEGQKHQNRDNRPQWLGHPGEEGVEARPPPIAGGAVEGDGAGHPLGDVVDGDGDGDGYPQAEVGQGDQGHRQPLGQVVEGDPQGHHDPAPVEPVAVGVGLAVQVAVGDDLVQEIYRQHPGEEEEVGPDQPDRLLGPAEEVDEGDEDHHPGGEAQADGEVPHVGPGDEVGDEASDSCGQAR